MSVSQSPNAQVAASAPKPERTPNGRFKKGNAGGPGNPFGRQLAQFRQALLSVVTLEHMRRLGELLIEKALGGDLAAAKLLLQYVVGKPQVVAEPDRVDIDEWDLARQSVVRNDIAQEAFDSMPITVGIATLPALAQVREQQFADMMLHPENYPSPNADDDITEEELAAELARQRAYMAAQAAEEAAAQSRAAGSTVNQPAKPSVATAAAPAAAKVPTGARNQTANIQHPMRRAESAERPGDTNEDAAAPSPNGTNGHRERRPSGGGDPSGRQSPRPAG